MDILVPEGDEEGVSSGEDDRIAWRLLATDVMVTGEYLFELGRCEEMMKDSFAREVFAQDNVPIIQHDGELVLQHDGTVRRGF